MALDENGRSRRVSVKETDDTRQGCEVPASWFKDLKPPGVPHRVDPQPRVTAREPDGINDLTQRGPDQVDDLASGRERVQAATVMAARADDR